MDICFKEFETRLGYTFVDKNLLKTAFTHTTYVFENNGSHSQSNQRLEYIGDAVLDLVVGHELYDLKPSEGEGYLSKMRSIAVCERSFAKIARELDMGKYLLLGKGEEASGGRDKDSTLADAFESVIAAVYFDGGFENARAVIRRLLLPTIHDAINGLIFLDYKSRLLEIAQTKNHQHTILFKVIDERGPAHQREFEVAVYADDILLATAVGLSKKNAEQKCAEEAIKVYKDYFPDSDL